jgi:hypothetical protein
VSQPQLAGWKFGTTYTFVGKSAAGAAETMASHNALHSEIKTAFMMFLR